MREIAVLVYRDRQRGLNDHSFDYRSWGGLAMIQDALERAGHVVGACDSWSANNRIVLASVVSQDAWYDLIAAWTAVKHSNTTLIIGGAGVLNVRPIIPMDRGAIFVLGRGEDLIVPLVEHVQRGEIFDHPSVLYADQFDVDRVYKVCMGTALYAHPVTLFNGQVWEEKATGCRYGCYFCNYSWCRKLLQPSGDYSQQISARGAIKSGATNLGEHNLRDMVEGLRAHTLQLKRGYINSAIDGQSQRIRDAVKKPVSREDLRYFGLHAPHLRISLMTIVGFPTETAEDRVEAIDDLWYGVQQRDPGKAWAIEISPNAFRPMPGTPCALWPTQVKDWRAELLREWGGGAGGHQYRIRTNGTLGLKMHWGIGGACTQLMDLIIHRGTESDYDALAKIARSDRFWRASAATKEATFARYFDLDRITGEQEPETYPARYLEGRVTNLRAWYLGNRALQKLKRDPKVVAEET